MTTPNPIPVVLTRQAVVVAPTRGYLQVRDELAARTHRIRNRQVDPGSDTLHRVAADTRAADLDLRLLGRPAYGPGKIAAAADRIAVWVGDGLQIVYADRGAPRPGLWNILDELRGQLAGYGIPAGAVRHLYQARDEADRAALLQACRGAGTVAVLVTGSRRLPADLPATAVALHHLDCPQSAADLRRREGAAGRAPDPPRIFRYITAGSGEPAAWAALIHPATSRPIPAAAQPRAGRAFRPLGQIRPGVIPATSPGPAAAGTGQHRTRGR